MGDDVSMKINEGELIEEGKYSGIAYYTYKISVPANAVKVRFTFYTATKDVIAHEYIALSTEGTKTLPWLRLTEENFEGFDIGTSGGYKYGDSLLKPFEFNGKTIVAFGDSITKGFSSPNNVVLTDDCYAELFATRAGATLVNNAVGGATITTSVSNGADGVCPSIHTQVTSYNGTPDFIIIAGGTNDFRMNAPLGEFGSTNTTDFYGSLHAICDHIATNFINATVIFITPINRPDNYMGYVATLDEYRNAVYEVACTYGHSVVDGSTLGLPSSGDGFGSVMFKDNVHPTAQGHYQYFKGLCGKLL